MATNTFQKTSASWGLIGGLLLLMSPMTANADIKTVSVKGEAAVIKGDKDQGLKDAKREARRRAVEEGAGVLVQSNTVVRNFQLVSDEITTSAKGVIVEEQWASQPTPTIGIRGVDGQGVTRSHSRCHVYHHQSKP